MVCDLSEQSETKSYLLEKHQGVTSTAQTKTLKTSSVLSSRRFAFDANSEKCVNKKGMIFFWSEYTWCLDMLSCQLSSSQPKNKQSKSRTKLNRQNKQNVNENKIRTEQTQKKIKKHQNKKKKKKTKKEKI